MKIYPIISVNMATITCHSFFKYIIVGNERNKWFQDIYWKQEPVKKKLMVYDMGADGIQKLCMSVLKNVLKYGLSGLSVITFYIVFAIP